MTAIALAAFILAGSGPTHIWFNLLEHTPERRWVYVNTFETLEECQALRVEYEQRKPGNYFCFPTQVILTGDRKNERDT